MGIDFKLRPARLVLAVTCLAAAPSCTMITAEEQAEPLVPAVASSLEMSDKSLANQKLQAALEKSVSGQAMRWQNPESGASGTVTPLKTWKTASGTYCRSYDEKIVLASGKSLNRRGVACRASNSRWESA